jgi:hypothetical protein
VLSPKRNAFLLLFTTRWSSAVVRSAAKGQDSPAELDLIGLGASVSTAGASSPSASSPVDSFCLMLSSSDSSASTLRLGLEVLEYKPTGDVSYMLKNDQMTVILTEGGGLLLLKGNGKSASCTVDIGSVPLSYIVVIKA